MRRRYFWIVFASVSLFMTGRLSFAGEPVLDGPESATQSLLSWYDQNIPAVYKATCPLIVHELTETAMLDYINSGSGAHSRKKANVKDSDDIDGVFDNNPPRIAVELGDDGLADTSTFAHEYGHYVWFDLMDKSDRKAYERIYKHSKDKKALVSDYAYENVEEGFAEAFSFYTNEPQELQRLDPDSYEFLANWNEGISPLSPQSAKSSTSPSGRGE